MRNLRQSERNAPKTARNTVFVTAIACGLAFGWAYLTELPEMAFAKGSVQPTGSLRRVEHLDGGVVEDIMIAEGDVVGQGDEIVRLSDVDVDTEIEELRVRERTLNLALERNRLVLSAIGFDGSAVAKIVSTDLRASAQAQSYEATRTRLAEAIAAAERRVHSALADVTNVTRRTTLESREHTRIKRLHARGLIGDRVLYESEIRLNSARAVLIEAELVLLRAEDAAKDARVALAEFFARTRETLLADIEATIEERTLVQRAIVDNRLRRDRIIVRSPVNGIVQALYLSAPGEVVEPGGLVAEVLPSTETLIAELQIRPKDIGHIAIGDPVEISLTTFNIRQYGVLDGWVQQISPTSTQNELRETYYTVRVGLEQQSVGAGRTARDLKAGMELDASIRTGNRTILQYILSPLSSSFQRAFRER